jgi:metallo-beta-lactamase family protein
MTQSSHTSLRLRFLGAAGTVTGSRFLLETPEGNLLVDCGLFQGIKKIRSRNWDPFPWNPRKIDAILLTHAHLDHVGYLPRLVKEGFEGMIAGTGPTVQLARIILFDSAEIQEEEAEYANRKGFSKHTPALPLYTVEDVKRTMPMFEAKAVETWHSFSENVRYRMKTNGHILGSVFIEIEAFGKKIVFSGDVGRENDLLLQPPKRPLEADILVMESTYGDRLHKSQPAGIETKLHEVIMETIARRGTLIIPSFALERAQGLVYILWKMFKEDRIPPIPVYLDSPMGMEVSEVFSRETDWHMLSPEDCRSMFAYIRIVKSFNETIAVSNDKRPKIIVAGSGMVTGGRVLHYLKDYLKNPDTTVMLVGYQAEGTRGRQLLDGAPEIKIHGNYYPVKAEIRSSNSLSGHADQQELIHWAGALQKAPQKVFLVHGEPHSADALRVKLHDTFGWQPEIPEHGESFEL